MSRNSRPPGDRNEVVPLLDAERFMKLEANPDLLRLVIGGGTARRGRGIVEFMNKPGCHRAKLDELLALLCIAFHIAQSRRQRPHDFSRHCRRGA